MSYGILGCPEQDSNLHASQHSHLKRARLPFRHLGIGVLFFFVGQIYGVFWGYAIGTVIFVLFFCVCRAKMVDAPWHQRQGAPVVFSMFCN